MHRAKLHRAKLHRAKLHRAKLHRAKLHRAKLHRAKLHQIKLHKTKLHEPALQKLLHRYKRASPRLEKHMMGSAWVKMHSGQSSSSLFAKFLGYFGMETRQTQLLLLGPPLFGDRPMPWSRDQKTGSLVEVGHQPPLHKS